MGYAQAGYRVGVGYGTRGGQLKGDAIVSNLYRKIIYFCKKEVIAVGRANWITYWNHVKATTRVVVVIWQNLVVVAKFGRGSTKS